MKNATVRQQLQNSARELSPDGRTDADYRDGIAQLRDIAEAYERAGKTERAKAIRDEADSVERRRVNRHEGENQ